MDENATTYRSDGSGTVISGDTELIPGRKMGCKGGLLDKVECVIGLWEQLFPKAVREIWVNPCQNGEEVGLEGKDGSLGIIAAVEI